MPRVAYIGNFVPTHSTENEVLSCFLALGWETTSIQEDQAARRLARGGVAEFVASVERPDLLLYTRTAGLPEREALELWDRADEAGTVTASLHLDLFYGLSSPKGQRPRYEMPARDPMFRTAWVFTPDGDHDDEWERDGVNHWWLPPAIGCDSCFDGTPDPRWDGIDVAFVGSRSYHPEWPHRERLVSELARRFGDRFAHVSGETLGAALRGRALHDLYASVPVIVGDSCWVGRQPPENRYWSDRVYEVWGRGGFLVMPWIDALGEQLGAYPCWRQWDDFDAMEHAVRRFASAPDRVEHGRKFVDLVRTQHTWSARIGEMLEIMGMA